MTTLEFPLNVQQTGELLANCAAQQGSHLTDADETLLARWHEQVFPAPVDFFFHLSTADAMQWDQLIAEHRAHNHPWYDFIVDQLDVDNMASFLLENKHYPEFLVLLKKILQVQLSADAVAAVQENIDDEFQPEPHAELMRKLMVAVRTRAEQPILLDSYAQLIDRTLVFYYGYYLQPWHLVGSLFATEHMGTHRVICMKKGLQRMGLTSDELAFTTVHSECDEHHADDWLQRVIVPTIVQRPELKTQIAAGIAECLETSACYLDFVLHRAQMRMAG